MMNADGAKVGSDIRVADIVAVEVEVLGLTWTGTEFGLAWTDKVGTTMSRLMVAALSPDLGTIRESIIADVSVLSGGYGTPDTIPGIVWSGSEYAVAWTSDLDVFLGTFSHCP